MTGQRADRIVVDRVREDDARSPANSHVLQRVSGQRITISAGSRERKNGAG